MRRAGMVRGLIRRGVDALVVLLVVALMTFSFVRLLGDPVSEAMYAGGATPEQVAKVLEELGYTRPIPVQFADYLWGILRGDFGKSAHFGASAFAVVLSRIPSTLFLTATSLALTLIAFLPLGFAAGRHSRSGFDRFLLGGSALVLATPSFVIGGFLILLFSVHLRLLPTSGNASWISVLLPALTLSLHAIARLSRVLRASMMETAALDYVQFGRAKGLPRLAVDLRYVLRNALLPVISVFGLQITSILGGAILVEVVFTWPGVGLLLQQALLSADYNVVQCIVILTTVGVLAVNFATDLVYRIADPRISSGGAR